MDVDDYRIQMELDAWDTRRKAWFMNFRIVKWLMKVFGR